MGQPSSTRAPAVPSSPASNSSSAPIVPSSAIRRMYCMWRRGPSERGAEEQKSRATHSRTLLAALLLVIQPVRRHDERHAVIGTTEDGKRVRIRACGRCQTESERCVGAARESL